MSSILIKKHIDKDIYKAFSDYCKQNHILIGVALNEAMQLWLDKQIDSKNKFESILGDVFKRLNALEERINNLTEIEIKKNESIV
ncbi:MAG: hypothetical protein ACE5J9_04465 [Methanosarcinales archaeon]